MQRILIFTLLLMLMCNMIFGQQEDSNSYLPTDTTNYIINSKSDTTISSNEYADSKVESYNIKELQKSQYRNLSDILETKPGLTVPLERSGITENMPISFRGGSPNGVLYLIDGIQYNNRFVGNLTGSLPFEAISQVKIHQGVYSARYGNSLSGVIEIVTKKGTDQYFGGGQISSSDFIDSYGYRNYSGYLGGPLIPNNQNYNFFVAIEYLKALDNNPRSINLQIPSADINQDYLPQNESEDKRFMFKLSGLFGTIKSSLSLMGSLRDDRQYIHEYSKNNSIHNPRIEENVLGGSFSLSQQNGSFGDWDLIFRYQSIDNKIGDGVWYENLTAYGDSARNAELGVTFWNGDGYLIGRDTSGVFYDHGRVYNQFEKYDLKNYGIDFHYQKQFGLHSIGTGFTIEQNILRYYENFPVSLAIYKDSRTLQERYFAGIGRYYGYDIFGKKEIDKSIYRVINGNEIEESGARKPIKFGFYIQDKFAYGKFSANIGLRYDYFDPNSKRIKSTILGNDGLLTKDDFENSPTQNYISPRLNMDFKLSDFTKIYAGYGLFRIQPNYSDIYDSWSNLEIQEYTNHDNLLTGHVKYETLTQLELGLRHRFSNWGSLDIVLFQNNLSDAITSAYQLTQFGQTLKTYITRINADNNISVKGLILNFDLWNNTLMYINTNYTYCLNTTVDSDNYSPFVAAFRNNVSKVSANYNWDSKHVLKINTNINFRNYFKSYLIDNTIITFRILYQNEETKIPGEITNILFPINPFDQTENTTKFTYSRIDLIVKKQFDIKIPNIKIIPYLSILNLFNNKNYHTIYSGTLKPDNSGFLTTPQGQQTIMATGGDFASDYKALERNPANYDIPRLIRLGLKVEF